MIYKILPDKERAKSIFKMALDREKSVSSSKINYPTIIGENYYEIIKELANALLFINGFKADGDNAHKEIIDSLGKFASFTSYEISILQDLRVRRNNSQYRGEPFDISYLESKKDFLLGIIDKLKKIVNDKLK
jgi:hypothetical protein